MGTLANREDQDEMQHFINVSTVCNYKKKIRIEVHLNLEISSFDPLKYVMDNPFPIVFICTGKFIRLQRVKLCVLYLAQHEILVLPLTLCKLMDSSFWIDSPLYISRDVQL